MATITKLLWEFHGSKQENPTEWVESAEVIAELSNINPLESIKRIIICMRGEKNAWGL